MNDMTLSSRHRIQNSSPGGLRPSTLPLGHGGSPQYVDGEETFLFLSNRRDRELLQRYSYPSYTSIHITFILCFTAHSENPVNLVMLLHSFMLLLANRFCLDKHDVQILILTCKVLTWLLAAAIIV